MPTSFWYYCNLLDETSAVVPLVQPLQNSVNICARVRGERFMTKQTLESEAYDELAVARSTYVLAAATQDAEIIDKTKIDSAAKVPDAGATDVRAKVAQVAYRKERKEKNTTAIKNIPEEPIVKIEMEATGDNRPIIGEGLAAKLESLDLAAETETETLTIAEKETATIADEETATIADKGTVTLAEAKACGTFQASNESIVEPAIEAVMKKKSSLDTTASCEISALTSSVKAIDVSNERENLMTPNSVISEVDQEQFATSDLLNKSEVVNDQDKRNIQAEIIKMAATEASTDSEVEETMVIDPVVAAEETTAPASSFSYVSEQICKNGYAVSSVAVAVTTAILATLIARR
ncbi:hypothetical protein CCR75_007051 [Bremia lactucae]|uniref:Uncharacterized protein n=1 Tax=Bremia lactucae TaxID=4779 RepID=A0A976FPB3_BRELC|nr:hypothetical protein CCR75_007051 [Bremia lactucae]